MDSNAHRSVASRPPNQQTRSKTNFSFFEILEVKKVCSQSPGYLFLVSPKHINQSWNWPRATNMNIFQAPHFDTLIEVQIVLKKINCLLNRWTGSNEGFSGNKEALISKENKNSARYLRAK